MGTVEMYADVMEEATNRVLTPLLVQEQELQIVRCHKTSHVEVVELIEHTSSQSSEIAENEPDRAAGSSRRARAAGFGARMKRDTHPSYYYTVASQQKTTVFLVIVLKRLQKYFKKRKSFFKLASALRVIVEKIPSWRKRLKHFVAGSHLSNEPRNRVIPAKNTMLRMAFFALRCKILVQMSPNIACFVENRHVEHVFEALRCRKPS